MNIFLSPVVTLIVLYFLFSIIFFRRKTITLQDWNTTYLAPLALGMVIPYHQLERVLINAMAGFWPVLFINTSITLIEIGLLSMFVDLWLKKRKMVEFGLFPYLLLIGLGMGSGRFLRDVLLVWYHPLSHFFGYSQFSNFITGFYLAQEILQSLIFVICAGFLGLGYIRVNQGQHGAALFSFVSSFFILEIDAVIQVLFQYVPSFAFFSTVYVISLLPLLLILGGGFLWFSYRRQERRESEFKKENSNISPASFS